jgi:hypothetical protein
MQGVLRCFATTFLIASLAKQRATTTFGIEVAFYQRRLKSITVPVVASRIQQIPKSKCPHSRTDLCNQAVFLIW